MTPIKVRDGETTIKIKFAFLRGWALDSERNIVPNAVFRGKCHDNKILNSVKFYCRKKFLVIAQAPSKHSGLSGVIRDESIRTIRANRVIRANRKFE